jgi:hypothetical protein
MARIDAMRTRADDDYVLDISLFKHGRPPRSTDELKAILASSLVRDPPVEIDEDWSHGGRLTGPGWVGDSAEREWANAIAEVVDKKSTSARKAGYALQPPMWLLIYDNLSLPMLNTEKSASNLFNQLSSRWPTTPFSAVIIESGQDILVFSPTGYRSRPIVDLWKGERAA